MIKLAQTKFVITRLVANTHILPKKLNSFCLCLSFALSLAFSTTVQADNSVVAARVWPAQDYTRITLESSKPFVYKMSMIHNPDRIVLDIENIELNPIIKSLTDKILASDPYIKQIRIAKYQQNIVRLVVDLKAEVKPNGFTLAPTGDYKYRLVLDVYPVKDPLMAMLAQRENAPVVDGNQSAQNQSSTVPNINSTTQPAIIVEPLPPQQPETTEPVATDTTKPIETNKSVEVPKQVETSKPANVGNTKPEINNQETQTIGQLPSQASGQITDKKNGANNADVKNLDSKNADVKSTEVKKSGRQIIIAIDAGHGGEDPGARGANGSREKDITLMIAKRLKNKIDDEPNMRAVLTRDSDYFIPLHGRVVKARKLQADLFVSIHADAFTNQSARGSSVFALSERGATSASARYLAKKENESDLIGGVSLDDKDPVLARTLLDLSQTATINDSLKLGKAVLGQIGGINTLHTSHVEQAAFAVLKSPDIPSILVETAFISNPEEERRLNDETYQDKLVTSILTGIKKYFSTNPALAKTKLAKE